MRKGFTLIELLVASVLLAMVVTILTMVFNQSSVAWRLGVASVVDLNDSRAALGAFHDVCDDVLPGFNGSGDTIKYRTVSLLSKWDGSQWNFGSEQPRAFNTSGNISWGGASSLSFSIPDKGSQVPVKDVGGGQAERDKSGYSVGVRSLGPDGKPDTEDDISTWPEEID